MFWLAKIVCCLRAQASLCFFLSFLTVTPTALPATARRVQNIPRQWVGSTFNITPGHEVVPGNANKMQQLNSQVPHGVSPV